MDYAATLALAGNRLLRSFVLFMSIFGALSAGAIDASNKYRSPRNPERPVRASTELIVLHTTEAAAKGSLSKLSERGEAHYCVTEDGSVYRIVDRDREAFHAGRSMWNGREDVDKFSIGIECVGYHDQSMPLVQLLAIRDLVKELKAMYRLSDDRVVCHSNVAYGAPNKWHKRKHRGRKQCGMLFAMPSVRKILELKSRASVDPDVRAKRLVVGDQYLERVLYGNVDTMASVYAKAVQQPVGGRGIIDWLTGAPQPAAPAPQPKQVAARQPAPAPVSTPAAAPRQQPQQVAVKRTAPKPQPAPRPKQPTLPTPASIADLRARGYRLRGNISPFNTASRLAGGRWNSPDTYYTIRNKVIPGDKINPTRIERDMGVWMR